MPGNNTIPLVVSYTSAGLRNIKLHYISTSFLTITRYCKLNVIEAVAGGGDEDPDLQTTLDNTDYTIIDSDTPEPIIGVTDKTTDPSPATIYSTTDGSDPSVSNSAQKQKCSNTQ